MIDKLLKYATPAQARVLKAIQQHGSQRKAAAALSLSRGSVGNMVTRLRKRAAKKEPELHNHVAPPGYRLKGVSTLLAADGSVSQTWVKTTKEQEDPVEFVAAFREAVKSISAAPPVRISTTKALDTDLVTVYPIGDAHIGMLAWGQETGADFDLKIAEANLTAAMLKLVELAPPSEQAVIINVGDFFHADNLSATTTAGTRLDVDSRYGKMLQVGLRVFLSCIYAARRKHKRVYVIVNRGNHDRHAAYMLSLAVQEHFRNDPDVVMEPLPKAYTYFEFGLCLLGTTHGDLCKLDKLPGIMAVDQQEAWGRTRFRQWYVGHFHHKDRDKAYPGCTVETIPTLAGSDAWHHDSGYRATRSMFCDVWHKTRGFLTRNQIGLEAL